MLRTRTIGLVLVVAFALSAVAASAASASKPEFKGPFPKAFTVIDGESIFETPDKKWHCTGISTGQGEITSAKDGTVVLHWTGCRYGTDQDRCQSAGANQEEVVTEKLLMTMGYIDKATSEVGIMLHPETGTFEKYLCEVEPTQYWSLEVKGGVVGKVEPYETNTPLEEFELRFQQSDGRQAVERLEDKTKSTLEFSFEGDEFENLGIETQPKLLMEEPTEIIT